MAEMDAQLSRTIRTIPNGLGTPKNGDSRHFVTFQPALKHQETGVLCIFRLKSGIWLLLRKN